MPLTLRENTSVVVIPIVVDEYDTPRGDTSKSAFTRLPRIADDLSLLRALFESRRYMEAGFQFVDPIRGTDAFDIGRHLKKLREALEASSRPLVALLFWSGHATTVGNELRLVTRDCFEPLKQSDGFSPADLAGQLADARLSAMFVMLDVCQAAAASVPIFEAAARRSMERPTDNALSMAALFAAYPLEQAHDGAFAECFTRLLRDGPSQDARRRMFELERHPINPMNRRLTLSEVAEAVQLELDVLPPGRRKSHTWPISAGLPPPLFPNPDYMPNAPPANVEQARQIAFRLDVDTHFMPKARGLDPGEPGWFFSGRHKLCAEIVSWIDRKGAFAEIPLFVLTGSGGTGKSALIGRLVALADKAARELARELGWRAEDDARDGTVPGTGCIDAALNLRGLSTEQVMQSLAELLGMAQAGVSFDPSSFVAAVPTTQESGARPTTLVLDSLDEATDPARLAGSLITSLTRRGVRVLVATRRSSGYDGARALVELLGPAKVRDLDELDDVQQDIEDYVVARLSGSPLAAASGELARFVAGRAEGKFLFARMATSALLRADANIPVVALKQLIGAGVGDELSRELHELDEKFQREFARADAGASALFVALAWSEGTGLPLRDGLWSLIATSLGALAEQLQDTHVRWVLMEGGRYIVEAGDGEQATYRLYHRDLVDELRARFVDPAAHERAVRELESHAGKAGGWTRANPYAIRHVVAHLARVPSTARGFERIVCNFEWIRAKLALDGPYVLLNDMMLARDVGTSHAAVHHVERALRQSAAVLARDPRQLPSHLVGRLQDLEGLATEAQATIGRLVEDARARTSGPWLRPVKASLADEASRRWLRPMRSETLTSIAFSRNGRWAVHCGFEDPLTRGYVMNLWDLHSWQQLGTIFKPGHHVPAMAITDDARHILYCSGDHRVSRWSQDGRVVCLGDVHPELTSPTRLHISDDGCFALSGTSNGTSVVAWDFETARYEVLSAAKRTDIAAIDMSRTGSDAIIVNESGEASWTRLWPAREIESFEYPSAPGLLARSADGFLLLALDYEGQGDVRDLRSPADPLLGFDVHGRPRSVCLSPDGAMAAIGTADGSLCVCRFEWRRGLRANRVKWTAVYPHGHTYEVGAVAFREGRVLSADYIQIKEWDVVAASRPPSYGQSEPSMNAEAGIVLCPDASTAFAISARGFVGWDMERAEPALTIPISIGDAPQSNALVMSKGKSLRLVSWTLGEIHVCDLASRVVRELRIDGRISAVAISSDGKSVACGSHNALRCWEVDSNVLRDVDDVFGDLRVVAFSPDKQQIAACVDAAVVVWRRLRLKRQDENERLTHIRLPSASASKALFVAARRLLVADGNGNIISVDTAVGGRQAARKFEGAHPSGVSALLCTKDGRYALTSSPFGGTSVWDVAGGRMLTHHEIGGVAFRMSEPFGRVLLSTPDGVLKVFDLRSGDVIASLQADRQFIAGDADDSLTRVVACDQGGRVHVLRLEA
jgi:WD40 repeat protein